MAHHPAGRGRLVEVLANRAEAEQARDVGALADGLIVRTLPEPVSDLGFPVPGDELARLREVAS
jgi:hypothetical protein